MSRAVPLVFVCIKFRWTKLITTFKVLAFSRGQLRQEAQREWIARIASGEDKWAAPYLPWLSYQIGRRLSAGGGH